MIRSIDAHLARKKLRESAPEVNAPETTRLHTRQVEGVYSNIVQDSQAKRATKREEREVLRKTDGRVHPRPLKVAGTSSV